jgi:hypothetical protein
MNKTWKWILGILLVLVIVGAFVAIGYAWQTRAFAITSYRSMPFDRDWNSPMQRGNDGWNLPMMRNDQHYRMLGGRGFTPFGGFFLLGGLAKLVIFFGLLYGAYWLGRRNARIAIDPKPAARELTSAPLKSPEKDS